MHSKLISSIFLILAGNVVFSSGMSDVLKFFTKYKKCFHQKYPMACLKEKVIVALNETILDDRPIVVGFVEIQKNPTYFSGINASLNSTDNTNVSLEATERSFSLTDTLMDKIVEFFKSRTLKVNLSNAFEGTYVRIFVVVNCKSETAF